MKVPVFLHSPPNSWLINVLLFDELITSLLGVDCESFHMFRSCWLSFGELSLSFAHFPMLLDCWSFSITLSHKVEVSFMLGSQENLPFLHSTEHRAQRTQTGK